MAYILSMTCHEIGTAPWRNFLLKPYNKMALYPGGCKQWPTDLPKLLNKKTHPEYLSYQRKLDTTLQMHMSRFTPRVIITVSLRGKEASTAFGKAVFRNYWPRTNGTFSLARRNILKTLPTLSGNE